MKYIPISTKKNITEIINYSTFSPNNISILYAVPIYKRSTELRSKKKK